MPSRLGYRRFVGPWMEQDSWARVAADLRRHQQRGLTKLLTEDVVRFATIYAFIDGGVDPADVFTERPHPAVPGARVDLQIGSPRPRAIIEFKFPREPNEKNAAWTMTRGEVLKDFYRRAAFPGSPDRVFAYVESARLRGYMTSASQRDGVRIDGEGVELEAEAAGRLALTARKSIGDELLTMTVYGRRIYSMPLLADTNLHVYSVDSADSSSPAPEDIEPVTVSRAASHPPQQVLMNPNQQSAMTARAQILDAARSLVTRSGSELFTPNDVVAELRARGTNLAQSTIRTMVTGHMCAEAPVNAATTYDDLERVGRGLYRLRRWP